MSNRYILGEGLGGILLPPVSETFGRKRLYAVSTLLYSVFCLLVAAVPYTRKGSLAAVIVGRWVTGLVAAPAATIAPGSLEDIYSIEARVWGVFAWTTCSNIGLILGPIYSSYVTAYFGW